MPKRKQDALASATPKASRLRTVEGVLEYYTRFRSCNERNGTNARGGGKQTVTDAAILSNLCAFVEDLGCKSDMRQQCLQLRQFLVAYGVSRTFNGLSEQNVLVLEPLVKHLRNRRSELAHDLVHEVELLVDACEAAGFNRNLSFASKCVCMLGHPVPIYSSEAIAYLTKHKGHTLSGSTLKSYTAFHEAWMAEYEQERVRYEAAAAKHLATGPEALRPLERRLGAAWFAMRGLDVRMMEVGGPLR